MVVGHSIFDDFDHLKLNTEEYHCQIRDVADFSLFRSFGKKRKLRDLSADFLNGDIQSSHHSSVIDARVALALYRTFQSGIENELEMPEFSLMEQLFSSQDKPC